MFINTKHQVGTAAALLSDTPADCGHDDGLVHNHSWANTQQDSVLAAPRRSGMIVADVASIRTPSCCLHDDVHYG